jgi:hypothetical protein
MREALALLGDVAREWLGLDKIPEVDWSRIRSLDFQETLRERERLQKQTTDRRCFSCDLFEEHVSSYFHKMKKKHSTIIILVLHPSRRENAAC